MRSFFRGSRGPWLAVVGGIVGIVTVLLLSGVVWWRILLTVLGVIVYTVVAAVLNEVWYTNGAAFRTLPYPRILALPTWLAMRSLRPWLPPDHRFKRSLPSLRDWAEFSTPLCRRFDLAFTVLLACTGLLIYLTVR